jgi:hypothetical protein
MRCCFIHRGHSAFDLSHLQQVQISKLEKWIKAQKQKTDLLTGISKLHKQHLHKLDTMVTNFK